MGSTIHMQVVLYHLSKLVKLKPERWEHREIEIHIEKETEILTEQGNKNFPPQSLLSGSTLEFLLCLHSVMVLTSACQASRSFPSKVANFRVCTQLEHESFFENTKFIYSHHI